MESYWKRQLRRRAIVRGAAVGAAAVPAAALLGCGDDDDKPAATSKPAGAATSAASGSASPAAAKLEGIVYYKTKPDPALAPKRGGKITAMYNGTPPHFDPATTTSVVMHAAVTPVYNRLVRDAFANERDSYNPWDFFAAGDLAESWEQPSPTQYTFKLRSGVKFQNVAPVNGRPFTAQDVLYSYNRYAKTGLLIDEFNLVDTVTAPDERTVVLKLKEPNADFLVSPIAKNQTLILPKEIEDADKDFKSRAIGTGPFILAENEKGVRISFKKNPDFWGKDKAGGALPYLDEYVLLNGDTQAQQTGFLSGQLDLTFQRLSTKADADAFLGKKGDAILYRWDGDVNTYNISFQIKTKPFNDARVRRAFSMAINWNGVNQVVFNGEADDTSFFYPWKKIFDTKPQRKDFGPWYKFDPAQAKKLLAEAGYTDGFNCTCEYNEYQPELTKQLEVIQQQLKDVGIKLDLKKVEYTAFFEKWSKKSFESLTVGFVPASAQTMDAWTYGSLLSGSPTNYWDVNDPDVDRLVKEQHTELDEKKRKVAWKGIWEKELDQVWRMPFLQLTGWLYATPTTHQALTPTRYHNYFHYGGAESVQWWKG